MRDGCHAAAISGSLICFVLLSHIDFCSIGSSGVSSTISYAVLPELLRIIQSIPASSKRLTVSMEEVVLYRNAAAWSAVHPSTHYTFRSAPASIRTYKASSDVSPYCAAIIRAVKPVFDVCALRSTPASISCIITGIHSSLVANIRRVQSFCSFISSEIPYRIIRSMR